MDLITVIIPLYNKEKSIGKTIESVLNQTYQNFELVIVNDGSTDKSTEIAKSYNDARITIYNEKNRGVSAARNFGIRKAKGDWIIFLDADDLMFVNNLEILISLKDKYYANILTANFYFVSKGREILAIKSKFEGMIKNSLKAFYLRRFTMRMGCALYHKNIFIKDELFREDLNRWEDLCFILSVLRKNSVAVTSKPVMLYTEEYRELSKPNYGDISKDYTYQINFKGKNIWEKLILGELLVIANKNKASRKKLKETGRMNFFYWSLSRIGLIGKRLVEVCTI